MLEIRSIRAVSALALCAALFGNSERASALQRETTRATMHPAGLCFRDPDIAADADSYYVTYTEGRCDGNGAHTVRLTKFTTTFSVLNQVAVFTTPSITEPSQLPLVRVSASGGGVYVAYVNRAMVAPQLVLRTYAADLTGPPAPTPVSPAGRPVADLSLDCDASEPGNPCVISTLEELGFGFRVVVRDGFSTLANVGPPTLAPGEHVQSIASVGGSPPLRGATLMTNVTMRPQVYFSPPFTGAMFGSLDPTATTSAMLLPGIAALRLRSGGGAAVWSSRSAIMFGSGSTWGPLTVRRYSVSSGPPIFVVDDAAQVGRSVLVVGRAAAAGGSLDGAAFASTEVIQSASTLTLPIVGSTVSPFGRTRAAAPTSCAEVGRAAAVYITGTAGTGPTTLNLVPFSCAAHDDCVDPTGVGGTCTAGRCSFSTGPCSRDSGVDSGVDASSDSGSDANFVPRDTGIDTGIQDATFVDRPTPPNDQGVVDAPSADAPDDAAMSDASTTLDAADAASTDAANADASDGAAQSGDGSTKPPSINGGACQCRAPATPTRFDARALVLLLAVAAVTARLRRRR